MHGVWIIAATILLQKLVGFHLFANCVADIHEQWYTAAGLCRTGIGGVDQFVGIERIRIYLYDPCPIDPEVTGCARIVEWVAGSFMVTLGSRQLLTICVGATQATTALRRKAIFKAIAIS
jgi:hypothetical protein